MTAGHGIIYFLHFVKRFENVGRIVSKRSGKLPFEEVVASPGR